MVRACRKRFGLGAAIRLMGRSIPLAFELEVEGRPGEYYMEALAVAPSCRNRGIGRTLLSHADAQARAFGLPVCSLSVLWENESALRFYQRAGYRMDRKVTARLHTAGVQYNGFFRMVKRLDVLPAGGKGEPPR
jgi:ribosomal protein S18 acetylase RimI-like enzyme